MDESTPPRPYTLIAELTYRCPLRCVYCSNPIAYALPAASELDLATWQHAFSQAEALGVMQLNLTGGEPLLQKNALPLMAQLCDEGYTVLLETSGAHDISAVDPRVHHRVRGNSPRDIGHRPA